MLQKYALVPVGEAEEEVTNRDCSRTDGDLLRSVPGTSFLGNVLQYVLRPSRGRERWSIMSRPQGGVADPKLLVSTAEPPAACAASSGLEGEEEEEEKLLVKVPAQSEAPSITCMPILSKNYGADCKQKQVDRAQLFDRSQAPEIPFKRLPVCSLRQLPLKRP
ncbi:MAG: hypothetical protein FRX49_07483 [Trebouxia sp. A1-2]|nr:MAG: hypothetical protein FRX49_07483 [Trebouxia sp. A1-2]